jgi:hypothetical protein
MKNLHYLFSLLFLLLCTTGYGQNIPGFENEIPVFPGAVRNQEAQKQALKDYQESFAGESLNDVHVSVYSSNTIPDEVCRFYINKLGAKEGFPEDHDPEMETDPWYEVSYFDNSWFEDQHEGNIKIWDGKWFKSALSERSKWTEGEWLQGAYFEWTVSHGNGKLTRHFVDIIDDNSFDTRKKTVNNNTMITIVSLTGTLDEE